MSIENLKEHPPQRYVGLLTYDLELIFWLSSIHGIILYMIPRLVHIQHNDYRHQLTRTLAFQWFQYGDVNNVAMVTSKINDILVVFVML